MDRRHVGSTCHVCQRENELDAFVLLLYSHMKVEKKRAKRLGQMACFSGCKQRRSLLQSLPATDVNDGTDRVSLL